MIPALRRHPDAVAAAAAAALPLLLLGRGVGPYRVPGHPTEMLHGLVLGGAQLRAWAEGGGWGESTATTTPAPFWPENLLLAGLEAALAPLGAGLGVGLGVLLAFWLAGFGPWLLARARGLPLPVAAAAGLLVQAAPPTLRGAASGEVAILALGPACAALALVVGHPRRRLAVLGAAVLALVTGAWGAAAGAALGLAAALLRAPVLLLALLPLAAAPLSAPSPLTGSLRLAPPEVRSIPAYVAGNGAVLPLPPAEAEAAAAKRPPPTPEGAAPPTGGPPSPPPGAPAAGPPAGGLAPGPGPAGAGSTPHAPPAGATPPEALRPGAPPPAGETGPLQRLPGGLGLWCVLAGGLALGRRAPALAGLGLLLAWTATLGLMPAPGTPPPVPPAWLEALGPWLPGLRPPVGLSPWLAGPLLLGLWALPADRRAAALLAPIALAALLENPRLSAPVTNLAPGAIEATLPQLDPGALAVFPSGTHPWRQGGRSGPELAARGLRWGRAVPATPRAGAEAALLATLSHEVDLPVDLAAAPAAWAAANEAPLAAARAGGFVGLIVDRSALSTEQARHLDGWLARRVGQALAQDGPLALYRLEALDADHAPPPSGTEPPTGDRGPEATGPAPSPPQPPTGPPPPPPGGAPAPR